MQMMLSSPEINDFDIFIRHMHLIEIDASLEIIYCEIQK